MSIKVNYSKIPLHTFQLEPAEKSVTLIQWIDKLDTVNSSAKLIISYRHQLESSTAVNPVKK